MLFPQIKVKLAKFYKELETIKSGITYLKTGQNVLRQDHVWHIRGTARKQAELACCEQSTKAGEQ